MSGLLCRETNESLSMSLAQFAEAFYQSLNEYKQKISRVYKTLMQLLLYSLLPCVLAHRPRKYDYDYGFDNGTSWALYSGIVIGSIFLLFSILLCACVNDSRRLRRQELHEEGDVDVVVIQQASQRGTRWK